MKEIKIVDHYLDKREFRNYVNTMLIKNNYIRFKIDDTRLSDDNEENDNDITVVKDNIKYTVQTYLNKRIGKKQIQETLDDMKKEKVLHGLIVTNFNVCRYTKNNAKKQGITILDRLTLKDGIYN